MTTIAANPVRRITDSVGYGLEGLGLAVLALLGIVPFVLSAVFLPLSVLVVAIPLLLASLGLLRHFADWHRRWAARVLGEAVPRPYRPSEPGMLNRTRVAITDPATWRDLAWTLVNSVAGTFLGFLRLALILSLPWGIVLTVLWSDGFGVGTVGPWLYEGLSNQAGWIGGLLVFAIGVLVNPALRRAHARLAVALLR